MNNYPRYRGNGNRRIVNRNALLIISVGLLLTIASSFSAYAVEAKSVATIVYVKGAAEIKNGREQRIATARQSIFSGDFIQTNHDTWLVFNFYDLTRVVLRPNSKFHIREFPETKESGNIVFELFTGAARVTTGTISADDPKRLRVLTPHGELGGGRSEWVVRVCQDDECNQLEKTFKRCNGYETVKKEGRQFVAVYKGVIDLDYCPIKQGLNAGETSIYDPESKSCTLVDQVPCFILLDQKLGQDKFRSLSRKLKRIPDSDGAKEARPNSRPHSRAPQPRPRIDRPRRPPRGR